MSGGSQAHDRIPVNCIVHLSARLDSPKCRVFSSEMKIKVPAATLTLDSLGGDLPLGEIYQGVNFDAPATS